MCFLFWRQASNAKSALGSTGIKSSLPFAREMGNVHDAALARIVKHDRSPPRTVASVHPS